MSTNSTTNGRYNFATRTAVATDTAGYRGTTRGVVGTDQSTGIGWTRAQVRTDRPWNRPVSAVAGIVPETTTRDERIAA